MSHVEIVGQSLSPALSVEVLEPSGTFVLKYDQQAQANSQSIAINRERRLRHIVDVEQEDIDLEYMAFVLEMEEGGVSDEEFVL